MFCKNCGYSFSDELEACPKCGKPSKEPEAPQVSAAPQTPVTAQVMQPTQSDNTKKGKKKNPAIKIIAIILAIAILIGGVCTAFFGIKNKNDIPDDALYIEEFPVITNETQFIVYDKEKFPTQEYEIKVERYLLGGALKAVSARSVEFNMVSTSQIYDLSLEDGSYRVTLTDISNHRECMNIYAESGVEEYKDIVPVIVIEIIVDGTSEESVNRVDINSQPGGELPADNSVNTDREQIEAAEEDFKEFEEFARDVLGYAIGGNFDCETASAEDALEIVMPYLGWAGYDYYFGQVKEKQTSKDGYDPLKKWYYEENPYEYSYYTFKEDKIKWICENILHVSYKPDFDIGHCYAHEGVVYKLSPEVGDTPFDFYFISHEYVDGKYEFIIETAYEYDESYFGSHKVTAALEMIDGKKYWTIYSVEKYSSAAGQPVEEENDSFIGLGGKKEDVAEEQTTIPDFMADTTAASITPTDPTVSTVTNSPTTPTMPTVPTAPVVPNTPTAPTQSAELPKIKVSRPPAPTVAVGNYLTAAVKNDGTVLLAGNIYGGIEEAKNWKNIVSVATGSNFIVGLKSDGTVVAAGNNNYGQCNVSAWRNIVAVFTSYYHTVGLKSDGTVVATGMNSSGQCDVSGWKNIVDIVATANHTVGLKSDGTVVATEFEYSYSKWHSIIKLSDGSGIPYGIKNDGTVEFFETSTDASKAVSGWKNISEIYGDSINVAGVKKDGTVVTASMNNTKFNVSGWKNIVYAATGVSHVVGLKSDGTLVASGNNTFGECDVSGWRNIKIPK